MRAPENNQNLNYKWCKISLRALTQKDWKRGKGYNQNERDFEF